MYEALQELRHFIALEIQAGFRSRETIINEAVEYMLDEYSPEWLEEKAASITDELLAWHYSEQLLWQDVTDCDRLDEAFAELDRMGIVARHDFSCCQTCGHIEIGDEIDSTCSQHNVSGYVFYHQQDTDTVVQHGYLYLAYGAVSGKESESLMIAHQVCDVLQKHGLETDWNGSIHTRICIPMLEWKRRRILPGWEI
jgi:hypothetical protein